MTMPGNARNGTSPLSPMPMGGGGGYAMPSRSQNGMPYGWVVGAVVLALASTYWYVGVGRAKTEAAVIREWAKSSTVRAAVKTLTQTPIAQRKKAVASRKNALLSAFKTSAQKLGAKELTGSPVPLQLADLIETKLVKAPTKTVAALQNAALNVESRSFPLYSMNPQLVRDPELFAFTGWGLLIGTALCGVMGGIGLIPKRQPFAASAMPNTAPIPVTAPRILPPVPNPVPVPPVNTNPFPPIPDTVPTINPPMRGSIAAGVAAVASSSGEVTRLVKRLEELESLSERLKGERDETRKELSWTQVALDDFKKRVADATTMAAASAAQSAGASEQRAAQAEQRVTEAVEHINEALQRAVETEQGVSRAKEIAQTAEERASNAEIRSQEIQFQMARAMERLADLEQLASAVRIGGTPNSPIALTRMPPPVSNGLNGSDYRNGHGPSVPSPIDDMLAAAARPTAKPVAEQEPGRVVANNETAAPETLSALTESLGETSVMPRQRVPPPRMTNTKMSDIEAGLKLARSIRSRTQKAAAKDTGED